MDEPRRSVDLNTLMAVIALLASALLILGWLLFPYWGW
jgi:hypothetical protein